MFVVREGMLVPTAVASLSIDVASSAMVDTPVI